MLRCKPEKLEIGTEALLVTGAQVPITKLDSVVPIAKTFDVPKLLRSWLRRVVGLLMTFRKTQDGQHDPQVGGEEPKSFSLIQPSPGAKTSRRISSTQNELPLYVVGAKEVNSRRIEGKIEVGKK